MNNTEPNDNETISDIENFLLSLKSDTGSITVPVSFMQGLARRIHDAAERMKADYLERIKAGNEVANAFHDELRHVLDLICYRQQTASKEDKKQPSLF